MLTAHRSHCSLQQRSSLKSWKALCLSELAQASSSLAHRMTLGLLFTFELFQHLYSIFTELVSFRESNRKCWNAPAVHSAAALAAACLLDRLFGQRLSGLEEAGLETSQSATLAMH